MVVEILFCRKSVVLMVLLHTCGFVLDTMVEAGAGGAEPVVGIEDAGDGFGEAVAAHAGDAAYFGRVRSIGLQVSSEWMRLVVHWRCLAFASLRGYLPVPPPYPPPCMRVVRKACVGCRGQHRTPMLSGLARAAFFNVVSGPRLQTFLRIPDIAATGR